MDIIINKNKLAVIQQMSDEQKAERKILVLNACDNLSNLELTYYILAEIISLEDLTSRLGTDSDRILEIKTALEDFNKEKKQHQFADEQRRFAEIKAISDSKERRRLAERFQQDYPNGNLIEEVKRVLVELEDELWNKVKNANEYQIESALDFYLTEYPNGRYAHEARLLKEDLPWAIFIMNPTMPKLIEYEKKYPGKHINDIIEAKDQLEWEDAQKKDTILAYQIYIQNHQGGLFVNAAKARIAELSRPQPLTPKERFLEDIRHNVNTYDPWVIQEKVRDGLITWDDLLAVFDHAQVEAIRAWRETPDLPPCDPPKTLRKDYTEIYFWGTQKTGKTCAIGAVLSYAKKNGKMIAKNCKHRVYMDQLSNIFTGVGSAKICNLPQSTSKDSIAEMNLQLIDNKDRKHNVTFIDLAGEVITGIYKLQNGIDLLEQEEKAVKQILSYLQNPYNNKIHFFVLEYNAADKDVRELPPDQYLGVHQSDVLISIAEFLDEKGGLRQSTKGVYGLVTKSDEIDQIAGTEPADRPRLANEYVNQSLSAFWNAITLACKKANVKDVKTIAFSIGNVFASKLCKFDGADSKKIVDRLLIKTKAEPDGFWGWLFK